MTSRPRHPYTSRLVGNETGLAWLHRIFVLDQSRAAPAHWHSHHDMEIICRLDGEQKYEIHGRPTVTQKAGELLVIPAEVRHRLANEIDVPGKRLCLFVREAPANAGRNAIFTAENLRYFLGRIRRNALTPLHCDEPTLRDFKELADLIRQREPRLAHWQLATVRVIVCDIIRRLSTEPEIRQMPEDRLIAEAVAWMSSHAAEKFRVSDLLRHIGYGQTRFFELFKAHTGLTPNDWMIRHRIKLASDLLRTSTLSAAAIGRSVGYPDTAYFFAVFKRHTGFTPTAFRLRGKGR